MKKRKKQKYVKLIESKIKIEVPQVLYDLIQNKVSLEQILLQLGRYYMFDGNCALTMLPIVTNERSIKSLENGLICKYVLENWEEVKKKAFKYFGESNKKER